ncbi:MAG: 5-(carboxyamino)imidazole ribonucleotide mutase [Flavobacteriales bacterium]
MDKAVRVGIAMGSASDLEIMSAAAEVLDQAGIPFEITIVSAHRTPERLMQYGSKAHQRGLSVLIAGAGGAAHLPGMLASLTPLPVIGVPILSSNSLHGVDSILSILQMPGGVPVATVGLNNAKNAGLLALRILGVASTEIQQQQVQQIKEQNASVLQSLPNVERPRWANQIPIPQGVFTTTDSI